jgi:Ser/Thr protein kinase RdoA (MazF antagonist)
VPDATAEFSSSAARPILEAACAQAGLDSAGAELLRVGENAMFQLASARVVVRIARSPDRLDRVKKELCVARWLAAADVPTVRVEEDVEQPLVADGYPVSFWQPVTGGNPTPTHADLARLLASFHALGAGPCDLPSFDPLGPSFTRLARAAGIPDADRDYLYERCTEMAQQYRRLDFALPAGPIHGDAWAGNLLTDHGQVVLLDFESAATGPREWDLMPTAVAVERYGLSAERYEQFAATYGFDVRSWAGYPVLREVRQLTMTTWLMQNAGESAAVAAEFSLRVNSLRERDFDRAWNTF